MESVRNIQQLKRKIETSEITAPCHMFGQFYLPVVGGVQQRVDLHVLLKRCEVYRAASTLTLRTRFPVSQTHM